MLNGWTVATIAVLDVGTNRNDLMGSTEPSWLISPKNVSVLCCFLLSSDEIKTLMYLYKLFSFRRFLVVSAWNNSAPTGRIFIKFDI